MERVTAQQRDALFSLERARLQRRAPRGQVFEQPRHRDRGTGRGGMLENGMRLAVGTHRRPAELRGGAARHRDLRRVPHRVQPLAPKPERVDVGEAREFRGAVDVHSQRQFVSGNAHAVVGDGDALDTTVFERDLEPGGSSVESVLEQFLEHVGGRVDNLARGDFADHFGGEFTNHERDFLCPTASVTGSSRCKFGCSRGRPRRG